MTDLEKLHKARSVFLLLVEFDKRREDLTSLLDDDYLQLDYQDFVTNLDECLLHLGYKFCLDYSGSPSYQLRDPSNNVVYSIQGVS